MEELARFLSGLQGGNANFADEHGFGLWQMADFCRFSELEINCESLESSRRVSSLSRAHDAGHQSSLHHRCRR